MADLHMEALTDEELVEVADQALASLNARYEDPENSNEEDDAEAAVQKSEAITAACEAWDRFADHFRKEST